MSDIDEAENDQITDADVADVVAKITEDDIRERSQALHDAQETWEELAFLSIPKIPCRECGGSGQVASGSFGSICVNCNGERMVAAPGAPEFVMPDFRSMRAAIGAYGDALALSGLPEGHPRRLALPAPATVPTLESIQTLQKQALDRCKQLQLGGGAPGVFDPKQLPEARPAKGLAGEGDLGEYDDAELAEMEDAANEAHKPRGKR